MAARKGRAGGGGGGGGATGPGGGVSTVEAEIERAREEGNWKRVVQLAEQLRLRPERTFETLAHFLIGEAKLEDFLEEYPAKEKNAHRAKDGLQEARDCLTRTIGDDAKKLGVHLDSYILLGKLNYAMANYNEALKFYERAQLDSLEEKQLPPRSLKIMAEAFAIKALCYEKISHTRSKAKNAEREAAIVRCYEISGDLTMLFLQVADKTSLVGQSTWSMTSAGGSSSSPTPSVSTQKLGPILEMALLKAPALNLKAGNKRTAVNRFRAMLEAEESESTKEIRRNVCIKLAEVLLHGISDTKYTKPEQETSPKRGPLHRASAGGGGVVAGPLSGVDSPWKPRKHGGSNLYTPRNRHEEVVLLLTMAEYMARKEAILSQAPEFFGMRSTKFRDAIISYDLTAIALSRVRSFRLLVEMLQHSMKFSFNEPHTWTQYGLALSTERRYLRSLIVFRELAEKNQAGAGECICTARLCYERLHLYDEGLVWARRALKKDDASSDHFLRARCNIYIGIGCALKCKGVEEQEERVKFLDQAEQHFLAANKADPGDHLAEFYLAYHYAQTRNTLKATEHVRQALLLQPEHLASLHLMALLLTSQGEFAEALDVVEQTLDEFPDNLSIIAFKVRLDEVVHGGECAILTAKKMLEEWQTTCEQIMPDGGGGDSHDANASYNTLSATGGSYDHLNGYRVSSAGAGGGGAGSVPAFDTLSDKDSVSLHAHSVTASHVERTLSEVASSLSAPFPRPTGPQDPSYTQMRIWLMAAEIHLRQGSVPEAELCAGEARLLAPLSYHLMHLRGQIYEARDELEMAKTCYENSLSVNPTHVSSLHRLGWVNHVLGFDRLAEQSLKAAVRIDPHNDRIWSLLGEIKEAIASEMLSQREEAMELPLLLKEETERTPTDATTQTLLDEAARMFRRASECQAIALSLQASSPILPFTTIPLCFE